MLGIIEQQPIPTSCKPWEELAMLKEMTSTELPVVGCKSGPGAIAMLPLNLFCDAVDKERMGMCRHDAFIPNAPTIIYFALLAYGAYALLFKGKG